MRAVVLVGVALVSIGALAAPKHERSALQREIAAAVEAHDWCRALHYTELLELLGHEPRLMFNAAELARAAGDLVTARAYYHEVAESDPGYAKAPLARQAVDEVSAQIAARGPGTRCLPPAPRCGDGAVEGVEACDDGNTSAGDGCVADCSRAPRCGDGIVDLPELCDDGNTSSGDHCSPLCRPEEQGSDQPATTEPPDEPAPAPEVVVHAPDRDVGELVPALAEPAPSPATANRVLAAGMVGAGVIGTTAGVVSVIIGPLPLVRFLWGTAALDEAARHAHEARDDEAYLRHVRGSGAMNAELRVDAAQWNGTGRALTTLGVSFLALGVAGIVGGALLARGTPDEPAPPAVELVP